MPTKNFDEIVADMKSNILTKDATLDTEPGSILRDAVIDPPADEIEGIYAENERVSYLNSLFKYELMTDDELDRYAWNWGKIRKGALKSTGEVTFRRSSPLTEDIIIPSGVSVSTKKGASVDAIVFLTTEEKIMYLADASNYYNSTSGYWEIKVPVEAQLGGEDGNVAALSILVISGSITGINEVVNELATLGGEEKETNKDLADRIKLALTGNNVGTEGGYLSTILANPYVNDAVLVGPGDDLMTRDNGFGGKVDIYINADLDNSNAFSDQTDSYTFTDLSGGGGPTDPENDHVMGKQPVKTVVSVVGSISGIFIEGTDWEYEQTSVDNGYFGSTRALDKIKWLSNKVLTGEVVTITYQYYSLMEDLDTELEDNRTITADILVKLATPISINVTMTVYADETITNNGREQFRGDVGSEIQAQLETESLAGIVQGSDLVNAVYGVSGVDRVQLPLGALNAPAKTEYATGVNDEILLLSNEYTTSGTITIVVILVEDT